MEMRFIYVMDEKAKKKMLRHGYALIKEDKENSIWIFENKDVMNFELDVDVPYVLSNVLTF